MKQYFLALLTLTIIGLSCSKNEVVTEPVTKTTIKKTRQAKPYVKVKGKPHRQNGERKEHGGPCDCNFCFGLCDVKVEVGWKFKSMAIKPLTDNTAKLYFLEELDETDEIFYVNNPIQIPDEALDGTGISALEILANEYSYDSTQETIYINDVPYTTYGFVTLNVEITEN